MDQSLDDYISKTNFKVKIGNSNFKPGQQQGKKRFAQGFQTNSVTDVSITVPAVRKTHTNQNRTNQVRDARDKLQEKSKPIDARERLQKKSQNTDARQKLITIRAQKEPLDARAKIQARKQQQAGSGASSQSSDFTLTRTVSNKTSNNIQLTPGPQGNFHITKTLTKVMPPGYEVNAGISNNKPPQTVTCRLGPPTGTHGISNLTRTVPNNNSKNFGLRSTGSTHAQPPGATRPPYSQSQMPSAQPVASAPTASQHYGQPFTHTVTSQALHYPSQSVPYPHPAQTLSQPYPPPQQAPYPPHQQQAPPTSPIVQPPMAGSVQQTPPYPTTDLHPVHEQVHNPYLQQAPVIPKIQVQNDQYRPPAPSYPQYATAAPQQHYAPPPQQPEYMYSPPTQPPAQPVFYQRPAQPEPYVHRTAPATQSSSESYFETIDSDSYQAPQAYAHQAVKRNSLGEPVRHLGGGEPLKLSSRNYVPAVDLDKPSPPKKKFTKITAPSEPSLKRPKEETPAEGTEENVISPLQGYKIVISNLATSVTQDDIIELFGAVGAVKSVRLVKPGQSEVIYVKKDDAVDAVKTYHDRELDGQPMVVKMSTPASARIKEVPQKLPQSVKPVEAEPLKLSKKLPAGTSKGPEKKGVDVTTLHKALFKTGASGPSKPVTFTVNI